MDDLICDYLSDCNSKNSNVKKIRILSKRGFLLDVKDKTVCINQFSSTHEQEKIKELMNQDTDSLKDLFKKDSAGGFESFFKGYRKWDDLFGSNRLYGDKVDALSLDPFVAKLMKTFALCGIFTDYSCDGWHSRNRPNTKNIQVGFCERYSKLWLQNIIYNDSFLNKIDLPYRWGDENHNNMEISLGNIEHRFIVYKKLSLLADHMYCHRLYFHNMKRNMISLLKGKNKSDLTDKELSKLFEQMFWMYMSENPKLPCTDSVFSETTEETELHLNLV